MALSKLELLKVFKNKLIDFLDALIEKLKTERSLITLRVLFMDQIPIETALQIFSNRILPYEQMVLNKDERFFLDCEDIFDGIKGDKVQYFKKLWLSPTFSDEDKEELWKWFQLFLHIAKKYNALQ